RPVDRAARPMRVHGGSLEVEAHAQRAALLGRGLRPGGQDGGAGGEAGGGQRGEAQETAARYVSKICVRCVPHAVYLPISRPESRGLLWPVRWRRSPVA